MWTFETDSAFQNELDWVERFVADEVEPLDHVVEHAWDIRDPIRNRLVRPLQDEVKRDGGFGLRISARSLAVQGLGK